MGRQRPSSLIPWCISLLLLASSTSARLVIVEQAQGPVLLDEAQLQPHDASPRSSSSFEALLQPVTWLYNEVRHEQQLLRDRLRLHQQDQLQDAISAIIAKAAAAAQAAQSRPEPMIQLAPVQEDLLQEAAAVLGRLQDDLLTRPSSHEEQWYDRAAEAGEDARTAAHGDAAAEADSRLRQLGWKRFKEAMADVARTTYREVSADAQAKQVAEEEDREVEALPLVSTLDMGQDSVLLEDLSQEPEPVRAVEEFVRDTAGEDQASRLVVITGDREFNSDLLVFDDVDSEHERLDWEMERKHALLEQAERDGAGEVLEMEEAKLEEEEQEEEELMESQLLALHGRHQQQPQQHQQQLQQQPQQAGAEAGYDRMAETGEHHEPSSMHDETSSSQNDHLLGDLFTVVVGDGSRADAMLFEDLAGPVQGLEELVEPVQELEEEQVWDVQDEDDQQEMPDDGRPLIITWEGFDPSAAAAEHEREEQQQQQQQQQEREVAAAVRESFGAARLRGVADDAAAFASSQWWDDGEDALFETFESQEEDAEFEFDRFESSEDSIFWQSLPSHATAATTATATTADASSTATATTVAAANAALFINARAFNADGRPSASLLLMLLLLLVVTIVLGMFIRAWVKLLRSWRRGGPNGHTAVPIVVERNGRLVHGVLLIPLLDSDTDVESLQPIESLACDSRKASERSSWSCAEVAEFAAPPSIAVKEAAPMPPPLPCREEQRARGYVPPTPVVVYEPVMAADVFNAHKPQAK